MSNAIQYFDTVVNRYLAEQNAVGLSPATLQNYTRRLKRFRDFWITMEPTEAPSPDDIRQYRDQLQEEGLSKATVKEYLIELKCFFAYASDADVGLYERNPVSKRMYPKITDADDKIYDKILSADDLNKLWSGTRPAKYGLDFWPRNYAIITLLLDGKIRNSELLNLKLKDINFEYNDVLIERGKGGKKRWVTLSAISVTAIKLYLNSGIRPDYCTPDDYLFGSTRPTGKFGNAGDKFDVDWHKGTRQWLSALVEKHIAAVTNKKGFRSHSLRHNGAVIDLNNGVSLERLQSELGHSSVTTTEIYSGRLQSVRKTREYGEVVAERNRCAEENAAKLAAMA